MRTMKGKQPSPANHRPFGRTLNKLPVKKEAALVAVKVRDCRISSVSFNPKVQNRGQWALQRTLKSRGNRSAKELFGKSEDNHRGFARPPYVFNPCGETAPERQVV